MAAHDGQIGCSNKIPLRPDPANLEQARAGTFEPPLDDGIRDIVLTLIAHGVETFESFEGGRGHSFPEPAVRFEESSSEGLWALAVALENRSPVSEPRRTWGIIVGVIHGPWRVMTFHPPKDSAQWSEPNTTAPHAPEKLTD